MTPKEAIKYIDDVMDSTYNYDETIDYQLTSDDFDWLEKAKEALEKQIPKKPISLGEDIDRDVGQCPNCKEIIDTYEDYKYCSDCGQAIDWRDVE